MQNTTSVCYSTAQTTSFLPMIGFSHFGQTHDISGVTSWLSSLLSYLRTRSLDVALNLHHMGPDPSRSELYQTASAMGVHVSGISYPITAAGVRDTLEFLNRCQPKVFLPQALPAPHFAAAIAANAGLPWIFTIHSDDPAYWALADHSAPARNHGVWVAVSDAIAEQARIRAPQADVRIIPYGVHIPVEHASWNKDSFEIVFLGRLVEEQKRASLVLEVLELACAHSTAIRATFIGDGSSRNLLESRVAASGLSDRIKFTGRLDKNQVRSHLTNAQAIILMSDYEGLPVALLEAMSFGCVPVVRKIRSGIPQLVDHCVNGILVEEVSEGAKAIVRLSSDPDAWQRMSDNARSSIQRNYSDDASLSMWWDLISELSTRSSVNYPLQIPTRLVLPPFDKRLSLLDRRRESPSLLRFAKRLKRKLLGKK